MMSRVLALDYGTKRIGVALSDTRRVLASPYAVLAADEVTDRLSRIVEEEDVEEIIVGLPVSLGGDEGASAAAARRFANEVGSATGLPVSFVDERFTTKVAENRLIAGGVRRKRRRDIRDKMAATVMLQGYLDSRS